MRRERARGGRRRRCGASRRGRAGTLRRRGGEDEDTTRHDAPPAGPRGVGTSRAGRLGCPEVPVRPRRGAGASRAERRGEGEEGVSLPPRLGGRPSRQRGRERVAGVGETGVGLGERHWLVPHVGEGEFEARTPSGL